MTFNKENCFEMNEKYFRKELAFPPTTEQDAIMLHLDKENGYWLVSGWNGFLDDNNNEAYGWEPLFYLNTNRNEDVDNFFELIKNLEEGI